MASYHRSTFRQPSYVEYSVEDESVQTQELVAMSFPPYGNPSTLMEEPKLIPKEWGPFTTTSFTMGDSIWDWVYHLATLSLAGVSSFSNNRAHSALHFASKRRCLHYRDLQFRKENFRSLYRVCCSAILVADNFFSYYSSIAHPDTLQILLVLLAIWVALCHVQQGDLYSLVGMGTLAG